MPKYETDISVNGFSNLVNLIIEYRDGLENKENDIVYKLVNDGVKIVKENANTILYGENPEEVGSSTYGISSENTGWIINTSQKATYLEFGTGIVGASQPHPAMLGWSYMVNPTRDYTKGWWFPTSDPRYIKKYSKDGRGFGHTYGYQAQPFFWQSAINLRLMLPYIAKEVFDKEENK